MRTPAQAIHSSNGTATRAAYTSTVAAVYRKSADVAGTVGTMTGGGVRWRAPDEKPTACFWQGHATTVVLQRTFVAAAQI
jgi:hypothetical protein